MGSRVGGGWGVLGSAWGVGGIGEWDRGGGGGEEYYIALREIGLTRAHYHTIYFLLTP